MSVITSIKQQAKKENRINVYLDNKFGFGIDLDNFVLAGLKVGQELTDEEIETIVKKAEFQKTLDKLLRFATLRPRSTKEVRDWFYKKKVHESIQNQLLEKLINLELLDDKKFALWWIDQRNSFKPRSKRLLSMELSQKGIDRETISEIMEESTIDEYQVALKLATKKSRLDKEKMVGYLSRKGFSWEIVEKVIGEIYGHDSDQKAW